jgi:lipopolysaccharide transport system permease protein
MALFGAESKHHRPSFLTKIHSNWAVSKLKPIRDVSIYSSESALRHPGALIQQMLYDFCCSWELAWRFTIRDIKGQYRQTFLGLLWAFLPPIATTALFVLLQRQGVFITGSSGKAPYVIQAFAGVVLWQLFSETLIAPLKISVNSKALLAKINFPRESLLISAILHTLFTFAIRLLLLFTVMYYFQQPFPSNLLWYFAGCLGLLLLGLALGILLLPIGLLYEDIQAFIGMLLPLWMLATPVVYVAPGHGIVRKIMDLNPVTPLLQFARSALLSEQATLIWPGGLVIVGSLGFLLLGWMAYRLAMPLIIERMPG